MSFFSAPEADEVKVILQQMLSELDDREANMAGNAAKTAQEVTDTQAKVTEFATSLVTFGSESDKDTQAADAADLKRQVRVSAIRV